MLSGTQKDSDVIFRSTSLIELLEKTPFELIRQQVEHHLDKMYTYAEVDPLAYVQVAANMNDPSNYEMKEIPWKHRRVCKHHVFMLAYPHKRRGQGCSFGAKCRHRHPVDLDNAKGFLTHYEDGEPIQWLEQQAHLDWREIVDVSTIEGIIDIIQRGEKPAGCKLPMDLIARINS